MKVITFGEIMGRIFMPGQLKFRQALPGSADITFAGAEANVAASIVMLGGKAAFVTALPKNEIAEAALGTLRNIGIDTSYVKRTDEGRLGLYFVEAGANQRPSKVVYDRSFSSVSLVKGESYPWDEIFSGATWFHVSGITPALSKTAAEATLYSVKKAKEHGLKISCDLNFRKKLWGYDEKLSPKELCRKTMAEILPFVDIVIGNEEDADDVMGIKAGESDAASGKLEISRYPEVAKKILEKYPNVEKTAFTLRESFSASHNNWGAMLYDRETSEAFFAPLKDGLYSPYEIKNIVDRIGGGDSFSAALIYSLQDDELKNDLQKCIDFATAASCLCHSIYGDFNFSTKAEVLALVSGDASGRVKR
ncbi:MAG: PfkB family carbohydrate kinase [Sphaerochaeta sp.]